MTDKTTILLAGATGMLGAGIANVLLDRPEARLQILVRKQTLEAGTKKAELNRLTSRGATIVEGDPHEPASLVAATGGVDVVISAVQGMRETIVGGQLALLDAAKRNGVRRIIPSDFAIDLFKLEPGSHPMLDWRREADEAIERSGLEHIHILNGAFHEVVLAPFFQVFDLDAGTITYWGDGDTVFDVTTVADTASYTAAAALDIGLPSGKLSIAGDQITMKQAIAAAEKAFARQFQVRQVGTVADLERWIADTKATNADFWAPIAAQYQWAMVSGKAKLTDLSNARYPEITPTSFVDFLIKQAGNR
ncbi:NmrA family NAD(P)-binding protein [Rhizobium sp. AG207R]|uniref:NmrA family NAD(P)-binding protein n=1 Tax=Rhizobium sp. AG207R TaxID=2802287 RepID=UPI0022AC5470|nr:NmrA family NAD(P)-binding protein [Rhizobium sp. AG207R]MCZ3378173.1 NmrA family NAD(P)-binding protein [Rhizobium sp. AG207R]